jgi:hypothetical protein
LYVRGLEAQFRSFSYRFELLMVSALHMGKDLLDRDRRKLYACIERLQIITPQKLRQFLATQLSRTEDLATGKLVADKSEIPYLLYACSYILFIAALGLATAMRSIFASTSLQG